MQRGMSSFIRWKRLAGEPMEEKRNRERFSIKFNENDPAHDAVIRLLEKQGPHRKAQFLVNAVLHYINCPETPNLAAPQAAGRADIEAIVAEILKKREAEKQADHRPGIRKEHAAEGEAVKAEEDRAEEQMQKGMDDAMLALIADTMSAFRSS